MITFAVALVLIFVPYAALAASYPDRPLSPSQMEVLRARYGLDQPIGRQLATFVGSLLRGDLGVSIEHGRPVTALLAERLPATMLLGGSVLLLNFTVSERTAGSPRCLSRAMRCLRSGSGWCLRGW